MARTPRTPRTPRKSKVTTTPKTRRRGLSVSADGETTTIHRPPPFPTEQEQLVEQLQAANGAIPILRQQVEACRAAFFRLATVRAANMVVHQAKSWDDGAAYINAEMQGLDAAIASIAQNGAAA